MDGNSKPHNDYWRRVLHIGAHHSAGTLESSELSPGTEELLATRLERAREQMKRIVKDSFGGDAALLDAVQRISLSGNEAARILEAGDDEPLEAEHYSALEVVVAFDGTRPSFLLQEDHIDFASSWATDSWKMTLAPRLEDLARFASCVGRVETEGRGGIGTAFLVNRTLAITNRHVAEAIALIDNDRNALCEDTFLDFGREHKGRGTHDRRKVRRVVFTGSKPIGGVVDHAKLDLALIEVSPSTLSGEARDRHLRLRSSTGPVSDNWVVASIGYPADWRRFAPTSIVGAYEAVLAKLLAGDAGSKRLAPGRPKGMVAGSPPWSLMHDATTINGNSGSPLTIVRNADELTVVGLHYGGSWQGQRTNWAHVLALCGDAEVSPPQVSLRAALKAAGVVL